ncbi:MAG: DUF937 domain-containing protein [bacterium]|nr:DUF937 domain-containing protein [bacterium]
MFDLMKSANSILGKTDGEVNLGSLAGSVMGMMSKDSGGINGLLDQFQNNGLGDIAKSWVSTGENMPISPDQLMSVFGHEKLNNLANKSGMDLQKFLPILTAALPLIIDKLTPDGEVNDKSNSALEQGMGLLSMFVNK